MVDRLRKRRDFLAAAKAQRAGVGSMSLQGRDRGDDGDVRVGFTVTKKNGNAVVRNRIRRRLRAAVSEVLPSAGRPGHDYVLIARPEALRAPFRELVSDLGRALRKLHDPRPSTSRTSRPKAPRPTGSAPGNPEGGQGGGDGGKTGGRSPGAAAPSNRTPGREASGLAASAPFQARSADAVAAAITAPLATSTGSLRESAGRADTETHRRHAPQPGDPGRTPYGAPQRGARHADGATQE